MRIIAGHWRGRQIEGPPDEHTRPILDRAKTILFDMLGARLAEPGYLPPLAVLDLFSGTGTLGIEALSRGARFCRFVEQRRPTAAILRRNLDNLQIIHEAEVIEADASALALTSPPAGPEELPRFELIFIDPPYRMLAGSRVARPLQRLFHRLAVSEAIADDACLVIRHEHQRQPPDLTPLIEDTRREVGTMTLRLLSRPPRGSDTTLEVDD